MTWEFLLIGAVWFAGTLRTGSGATGGVLLALFALCPVLLPFIIIDVVSSLSEAPKKTSVTKVVIDA